VIALDCDLAIDTTKAPAKGKEKDPGSTTGSLKMTGTFDTVIDGTSREGTLSMNIKMDIVAKQGPAEFKIAGDMVMTKTIKPVQSPHRRVVQFDFWCRRPARFWQGRRDACTTIRTTTHRRAGASRRPHALIRTHQQGTHHASPTLWRV